MNKLTTRNLRLVLILTSISGVLWIIYIAARTLQPPPVNIFAGKTVEPLNLELRIDTAEEL